MRSELHQRPVVGSWDKLIDYCTAHIAHGTVEEFHILFLDRKNVLSKHEQQQRGTIDHTPVYPREVVKRALELQASALILVHNHPSGDPTPSKADIAVTQDIKKAAAPLGVVLHDHVIIARNHRTQEHNRRDAQERLSELIRRALIAPKPRKATKPTRAARARRLDSKTQQGRTKRLRGKPGRDD